VSTTETTSAGLVTDLAGLRESAGRHLGHTDWQTMTQERVNEFAAATDDHNYIHVDPERAKTSPFGGTIAHGFLSLALLAPVTQQLLQVTDASTSINYGLDKVRFPAPVPVGAQFRGTAELVEVSEVKGGLQAKMIATIEVKDTAKPALVAECLIRHYA
jgi:acyl dehydratase